MAHVSPQQDLSPQDSTFLFISTLQEQLAKSEFVTSINNPAARADSPSPAPVRAPAAAANPKPKPNESSRTSVAASLLSSSSSAATKPSAPKWPDKESQGARITRLKPPRQAK
ncbi:uncharacterized protein Z519_09772 [Cladophialophora bantiana CBS 173.52]|uniref:Uncharacterized protein n=1 Tax=Cladophialophora bantiana (strain ATCC 10958 / CBS 173.52 / CDC B-1940 / NIH 8579) TaxID=1442370 RepID=A0A0D2EHS5_CLAB1|nr:uncharacterized protein Z519_09772 [Cladophialophora bantiana CBS 173.52]KIW89616.1 hypothetical protein Z519_09772 [Cladophialophora bantiana CBS 173.52]